jgi:hypothetical protein
MKCFLHRCHASRREEPPEASWSQEQQKAALAAVKSGRKIWEIGPQLDIHKATLRKRLKLNLTSGPEMGHKTISTEEQEWGLCDHLLQLSDMFWGNSLNYDESHAS